MEMQQFLSLSLQPRGQCYGPKEFNFNSGTIDSDFDFNCKPGCAYEKMTGLGDDATTGLTTQHAIAEKHRRNYIKDDEEQSKPGLISRVTLYLKEKLSQRKGI